MSLSEEFPEDDIEVRAIPLKLPINRNIQPDFPPQYTGGFVKSHRPSRDMPDGSVKPFPRERFLNFIKELKIQSRDIGLAPLQLLGSQFYVLDEICAGLEDGITTFIILKARQLGMSTFMLALDLFWAFEHDGMLGVLATHDEGSRDQFINQLRLYIDTLPKKYKVGLKTSNRIMMVLNNTSLFRFLVAGSNKHGNTLGRSGGCNFLHSTETAFYGSKENIDSLNQTLSEKNPNRLYIYESTANGFNHYAEMWEIAKASPAQKAIFVGWWRNEMYEFSEKNPLYLKYMPEGRKTILNPLEMERIGRVREEFDFDITAGQIAWYRFHLETKCNGDQGQMDQEMPWTPEDAFVSTGSQFFTDDCLTNQLREARKHLCQPFIVKLTKQWTETAVQPSDIFGAALKIWEAPNRFGKYVIGCDPAYGSSAEADHTVISVFRCYADKLIQVAEYSSPSTSTYQCAWVLCYLAGLYGDVMVNLEITGPGTAVFQEMNQLQQETAGYNQSDNIELRNCLAHMRNFLYRKADSLSGGVVNQWRTSFDIKRTLLNRHKDMLERDIVQIRSLACLEEHRKMVIGESGGIAASGRHKDDKVIASALATYAWAEWVAPQMKASGHTYDYVKLVEEKGGEDPVQNLFRRWLKEMKIKVRDDI